MKFDPVHGAEELERAILVLCEGVDNDNLAINVLARCLAFALTEVYEDDRTAMAKVMEFMPILIEQERLATEVLNSPMN